MPALSGGASGPRPPSLRLRPHYLVYPLGELGYFYRTRSKERNSGCFEFICGVDNLVIGAELTWLEKAKLLETVMHKPLPADEAGGLAAHMFTSRWREVGHTKQPLVDLLRTLFNGTSLSPYTTFVDRALKFVERLEAEDYFSPADRADLLGYLLRHLGRHLTAYDLVTFHHRGANYPDALLLDTALKAYLQLAEDRPELFAAKGGGTGEQEARRRLRRRALRQGWLLRRWSKGLPVPDAPTSPGENARILPLPHCRVTEEQILDPSKRTRRTLRGRPAHSLPGTTRANSSARERSGSTPSPGNEETRPGRLFGPAPGDFKATGEPDQTLLLSYKAFSRSIAEHRLQFLARDTVLEMEMADADCFQALLHDLPMEGISPQSARTRPRPETVSLQDACKAADDFELLRTTHQAVRRLSGPISSGFSDRPVCPGRFPPA